MKDKTTILLVNTHKDSFGYGVRAIPGDIPVTFGAMPARGARDVSSIWFQLNATDYHHLRSSNDSFKQPPRKKPMFNGGVTVDSTPEEKASNVCHSTQFVQPDALTSSINIV